jgi:uridine kinase
MAPSRPYLIGIAGPSCSGKSELTRRLSATLGASVLTLDSYYREMAHLSLDERARCNFDEPGSLDEMLVVQHVQALSRGETVGRPTYDFSTHSRKGEVERIVPGEFAIVEGLFALYWLELRKALSTKVYIHAADEVCFERRLARDVRDRGRTPESVHRQYSQTVRPMAERYVWPTRHYADLVVSGVEPLEKSSNSVLTHIKMHVPHVDFASRAAFAD